MAKQNHKLAAIMFTDIVGYTALMDEDEDKAFQLLEKNRTIQRPIIEKHNGKWLKEMGDGILAIFEIVSDAVYCGKEIQETCESEPNLSLRIGIHLGEVIVEHEDVFGSGVNIASRLEEQAPAGGIYVSESVHKNVTNRKGIETKFVKKESLKHVKEPVRIYEVIVEHAQTLVNTAAPLIVDQPKTGIKKGVLMGGGILILLLVAFASYHYGFKDSSSSTQTTAETNIDKSIAVLPFVSLSTDPEKQYLADAVMDAILLHLSKIGNLRVITRTSVERYRNTTLTIPEIAAELNVEHVLEGSFQKHGDQANLIVQLSNAQKNEGHLWAEEFNRNWSNIFAIQSEVAQLIATKLKAVITPEEKQLIEKIPTTNLTALDFYQRGRSEHTRYGLERKREALEKAEDLYYLALEYDSTFALAYTSLAQVYFDKNYWDAFLSRNLIDSVLVLANIALSFDDQLAEAYVMRGKYYRFNYDREQAISEYDKAIKYNPNLAEAYWEKGQLHSHDDLIKSIYNLHKSASFHRGPLLPAILRRVGDAYARAGFKEKAIYYEKEALKLDSDSAAYYRKIMEIEDLAGNFQKSIEFGKKSIAKDSTNSWVTYLLGIQYMFQGEYKEYLNYMKKHSELINNQNNPAPFTMFRIGHAYWVNGYEEEAESRFKAAQDFYDEMIKLGRHFFQDLHTFYNLAAINAFLGNKEKAYEYLGIVNHRTRMPIWMVKDIKNDPWFDNLRDDQEFQQIVIDVEAKYQAEHERVRVWLEKEGML